MIPEADLVALREDAEGLMTDELVVSRAGTPTPDGQGGETSTWAPAGTVAAALWPTVRIAQEDERGGRVTAVSAWRAVVPAASDVRVTDRVVYGTTTMEVRRVSAPRTAAASLVLDLDELS